MKRSNRDKELDQLQSARKEVEKLKRQLTALRKQLSRINLEEHENLKKLVEIHQQEDQKDNDDLSFETLKKQWKCKKCNVGTLEIVQYNKVDNIWYYRQCNSCDNRTLGKRYTNEVKGILKK